MNGIPVALYFAVMRFLLTILLAFGASLPATTLEKLTFDEMVAKSTSIVRGRIRLSNVRQHGAIYYSHYQVQVAEQFKGPSAKLIDVVLPGGTIGRSQQTFSGVPSFPSDSELVLFLWTAKSGLTHIIGLSQGIFQVTKDANGSTVFSRDAIREGLVNSRTGRPVADEGMRFTADEFSVRVRQGVTR
ncbi:MAG: hypothetical protein JNM66_11430 [Bryobacterales bacterium]|nr:hypothetical protein [Bryobacterales bacterium]